MYFGIKQNVPNFIKVLSCQNDANFQNGMGVLATLRHHKEFVDALKDEPFVDELKKKGKRHSDYTRALIKDKLSDKDNEIATTSCKVSLACPLGKQFRIQLILHLEV